MREASPAFVHASDVYVACDQVASDLHVADEGALGARHDRAVPRRTVVSGEGAEDVCIGLIKVVPGNVHVSVMRRGWVVVQPARLAVVFGVVVNAVMRPAGRRRSQGVVDL